MDRIGFEGVSINFIEVVIALLFLNVHIFEGFLVLMLQVFDIY